MKQVRLLRDAMLPFVGLTVVGVLWWFLTDVAAAPGSFTSRFAPGPAFRALGELVTSGALWPHVLASAERVALGLLVSAALGIPLGVAIGSIRWVGRMLGPVIQVLRMVSPLAWMPLALLVFGTGTRSVVFLLVMAATWPILLSTVDGVARLDPRWSQVGRSLGASRWELVRHVVWPGVRPRVLAGLRLAVGVAWIVLVPAEMLGVDSGLGYAILDARDRLDYGELMAMLLVIAMCGIVLDGVARFLFREARPRARRVLRPIPEMAVVEQRS
ncbi:ABC transporter permease [Thermomicrobium sp. 4228-Ro]|uniref:ABC transporter permease n=1 Tax=Thermomicrobium sp. 4228-Ro TaxID=2993937 RepID=UPI002248D002|nr:ABC transporter permease [Thermomicrobium sp. 4228-Ro]MCX2728247.1 ABC transporter permease [Thermomicrobium sp. 4228-Ro]